MAYIAGVCLPLLILCKSGSYVCARGGRRAVNQQKVLFYDYSYIINI